MHRFAILLAAVLVLTAPAFVYAGFEPIVSAEFTVDSGTSFTTVSFPFVGAIRDGYLACPELDADDTATLSLTVQPFDGLTSTVVPLGWSDLAIGATSDANVIGLFATSPTLYVNGMANFKIHCSSNQAADRTFRLVLIREY